MAFIFSWVRQYVDSEASVLLCDYCFDWHLGFQDFLESDSHRSTPLSEADLGSFRPLLSYYIVARASCLNPIPIEPALTKKLGINLAALTTGTCSSSY